MQNLEKKPKMPQNSPIAMDFGKVNFITITDDGQRLDNFLLGLLKGVPRSHVYKLIRDKEVLLNKKRAKPHDRLYVGDVLRLAPIKVAAQTVPVVGEHDKRRILQTLVYEDEGLMVLNKPSGMAVHGGSGLSFGVIEALRAATGKSYLELVHRIDKDTSGLLLVAKKRSTLKALQEAFRSRTIKKSYLCVCLGDARSHFSHLGELPLLVDKPLLRFVLANGERRVKVDKAGKPSQTYLKLVGVAHQGKQALSLIQAMPVTGRTHQIRVHLASLGLAILGDEKYAHPCDGHESAGRLMLHAHTLAFDGRVFEAPIPKVFLDFGFDGCG